MPSTSPWLESVMGTTAWQMMQTKLSREKARGATWQNLLAVHTSTCCQPGKAVHLVASSLEEAGLLYPITDPGTGKVQVKLRIPEFFPNLNFGANSSWQDDHEDAKQEVCLDTLTFGLLLAPHLVAMHPCSVKEGETSIARIREIGDCVMFSDQILEAWQGHLKRHPPTPQLFPRPTIRSPPLGAAENQAQTQEDATATSPPSGLAENEAQAVALIQAHYPISLQWLDPSRLNRPVFEGLSELRPRKSLRRFLASLPELFEVDQRDGHQWVFRRIA